MGTARWLVILLLALLGAGAAQADRFQPGVLSMRGADAGVRVELRLPPGAPELVLEPPKDCTEVAKREGRLVTRCPEVAGSTWRLRGLAASGAEVILRVQGEGLPQLTRVLRGDEPIEIPSGDDVDTSYMRLGVVHILVGWDHLAFVFLILLLLGLPGDGAGLRRLVGTVTAFTVGHSATLALATLGLVSFNPAAVEALIALSIVLLAREVAAGGDTLTRRRPWLVSGGFGLVHGLGFATVLSEIGLPADQVLVPLVGFNVGVEIGQLAFLLVASAPLWAIRRALPALESRMVTASAWSLGVVGAAAVLDRAGQ